MTGVAFQHLIPAMSRAIAPRKHLRVSEFADAERILSPKDSAEPGPWRTTRNPLTREVMDCFSARSSIRDVVCMFPIQFAKTQIALNVLGYVIVHNPGPVMVCLPGEVSMNKWIAQKLNTLIEETPAVRAALTSHASRDSANQRTFKDFSGGQLYIEHAGSSQRLKSSTVRTLIVDELDEFAANMKGGDDPVDMLDGRTSAFPATYKRLYISTPQIQGISRTEAKWEQSDKRHWHITCPDCGEAQPLLWAGLHWSPDGSECWYACRGCGVCLPEHSVKSELIPAGRWIPEVPGAAIRGYQCNGLYYSLGLGPRWLDLVRMWRDAQGDIARLKTFINDRLAEPWEDPAMRSVKMNIIADRAEPYPLRTAPDVVLEVTIGVDTQDNRLAVQTVGWGPGKQCWVLDYVELPGDPAEEPVWVALTELANRPIQHATGALIQPAAVAIDAGGHRTEAVKAFVRARRVRRPMCIFGAVPNNAPVLSKGKLQDINFRGKLDKRGVHIHHVGTVGIKHVLFAQLSADTDKDPEHRIMHFSEDLPPEYFSGLVSETYNPVRNRFEKRRGGGRNEPLDTWGYAYAATHHPELRFHRRTRAEWDLARSRLMQRVSHGDSTEKSAETARANPTPAQSPTAPVPSPFTRDGGRSLG